jgi:Ni/Fe-hydrogenase subunit HybB-like protein
MQKVVYREWGVNTQYYWKLLASLAVIVGIGGLAALYMEHEGHQVTGMTNLVVWGAPHMFAVFLVVAASGALNIASIPTLMVFKEQIGIFSQPGALPAEIFDDLIQKVRDVDMEDVRNQMQAQQN